MRFALKLNYFGDAKPQIMLNYENYINHNISIRKTKKCINLDH